MRGEGGGGSRKGDVPLYPQSTVIVELSRVGGTTRHFTEVTLHYHSFSGIRSFCITWPRLGSSMRTMVLHVLPALFALEGALPAAQNKVFLASWHRRS